MLAFVVVSVRGRVEVEPGPLRNFSPDPTDPRAMAEQNVLHWARNKRLKTASLVLPTRSLALLWEL